MLTNLLLNPNLVPLVTLLTLLIISLQIWWNWHKNQPKSSIENIKITTVRSYEPPDVKEIVLNISLYIKNHSKTANSVVRAISVLEGALKEKETDCYKTIQGKTSEHLPLELLFLFPKTKFKEQYKFTITFFDQHKKTYSSTSVISIPKQYL